MTVTNEEILMTLRDVATSLSAKIDAVITVQAEHSKVLAEHSKTLAEHGSQIGQLQTQVGQLQSDMTDVKHAVGTNHLKLSGKIEIVASMLADHMVDHHEPAGRKRA